MEKRAFTRQVLHQPGHLSSPQQNPVPCIIKDFCKTGLFITFEDTHPEQHQPLSVNDALFIDFKSSGILQLNYRLHVRVARILDQAIGVEITHNNPEAIHALYKLAKEPAAGRPRNPNPNYEHVQDKCQQLVEAFVESINLQLCIKIDDALMDKAQQASNNAQASTYVDTAARFRKYQDRINHGFHNGLMQQVENWLSGNPVTLPEPIQSEKTTNLKLVGKDDFEDWLLVKVAINKAEHHYKQTLYDLQLRMTEMTGAEVNYQNNPVSPAYVGHAFYHLIAPMHLPRDIMQTVLSAFEAHVIVDGLKLLYVNMNRLFIDNDILPTINYQTVKSEQHSRAPKAQSPTSAPSLSTDIDPAMVVASIQQASLHSARTLSAVQHLISLQQQASGIQMPTATEGEPLQYVATDQLISQLTQLQNQLDTLSGEDATQPLSARVSQWCGEGQQLSERDSTAVNVTEKFFDSIDSNQYLSDSIKPLLKQLEIPLLKIFIKDESFFEDANHPARQVLNRLARLGSHGGALSQLNAQKVEQVIQKISEQFNEDLGVFNEAAAELDELITRQETATHRNTERLLKSCDGLETIEKGKYTIRSFIEEYLSGKVVPKVLVELVNRGWSELLVFTLLRDGQNSAIWNSYANVVKSLAKINPQTDLEAVHQLGGGLLKIIEIGIKEAPGGQLLMKQLLPDLTGLLAPESNSPAPEFVEADTLLAQADDSFSYIDDEAVQSQALSRWVRRARNLSEGAWVEYDKNDSAMQMRLAWVGEDHHKFVFVNHQGMKVVELSLRETAEQLQSGHAKLIDDPEQPFVDQNLDTMVQNIYNQMNYQATHDELTGLINRKEFERQLGHALTDARKHQNTHTFCHMNLDQFKLINTSCGHEAGDLLLKQISELLTFHLRKPNVIARTGGDEFLFILKNIDTQSAKNFAEKIKEAVQNHRFVWDNNTYTVGASIGLVAIDEASENISALINAADSARLSAKEAGGNKVHVYELNDRDQVIRTEVMNNMALLNKALDEERLKLRCQKIAPVAGNGAKPHYEVLLSVEDELGIHLAPGEFIRAAERYNRIQDIDRWVIHHVFQWSSENRDKLEQLDCCTINLSGHSLNDESLMDYILDELLVFEIPRDKICFEVTEATAVKNLTDAVEIITELKDVGFKFALDNFGAGLSSYTYLKKIPVDYLKIDGALIKGIADNPSDLAMVQSINEMAHLMGKKTIAEYVENAAIQEKLTAIGVDYVQGYHIEKPIALDTLLQENRKPALVS